MWSPFKRPKPLTVYDLARRQAKLARDIERLEGKMLMEHEVYSAGDRFAKILKKADINKIPH